MRFSHSYRRPVLDLDGYKSRLDQRMKEVLSDGLTEWLNVVLKEVPVWSGASRATFVKLGQTIGFQVPIGLATTSRHSRQDFGMSVSEGKLTADIDTGKYEFLYETLLPWLIWNEYHNANIDRDPTLFGELKKPGPYDFQNKGLAAFIHVTRLAKLPEVAPFVRGVPVR